MEKFKAGDKVRLRKKSMYYTPASDRQLNDYIGTVETVSLCYIVSWVDGDGRIIYNYYTEGDLLPAVKHRVIDKE